MKKPLLLLALFTLSISNINAQWVYTNGPAIPDVPSLAPFGNGIYAGTTDGVHIYDGNSWSACSQVWGTVNAIVPRVSDVAAALWIDAGVYFSSDTCASWESRYNGMPFDPVGFYLCSIYDLKADGTALYAATHLGVSKTIDDGMNWTPGGLLSSDVRALTISGTNIFAGTFGDGAFHSTDSGNTWTAINSGLDDSIIISLARDGNNLFAGSDLRIFHSTNDGSSWTLASTGLPITMVYQILIDGANIFAATSDGIFLSQNNGSSWSDVGTGLTQTIIKSVTINGANLYAGTSSGGVWVRPLSEMTGVISIQETPQFTHSIFPNPFSTQTALNLDFEVHDAVLTIYNAQGQSVRELSNISGNTIVFQRENLPEGIYYIRLTEGENIVATDKVVITKD